MDVERRIDLPAAAPEDEPQRGAEAAPRSRRNVLRSGLAGLIGLVAGTFGRPAPAEAAAGQALIVGSTSNNAGTSSTQLITNANLGVAFSLIENGAGTALMGYATPKSGSTRGVYGRTDSSLGAGVQARNGSATKGDGAAIQAYGVNNDAIQATTASDQAIAVSASNDVVGIHGAPAVRGLTSMGTAADAHPNGGFARGGGEFSGPNGVIGATSADQINGFGVLGIGNGSASCGVFGYVRGTYAAGVYGTNEAATGIGYGVFGRCLNGSGYALYGEGRGAVTGAFSKASGSFKIDHPLDPAHKYLYHSFVESPDMKNVYDGIVTLDAKGEARVTLPDWFEALNRDFRYQLTPIGAAMPELHVKTEVEDNTFTAAGGRPGERISWQLTGIRRDAWANAHRVVVEEPKPAEEQGRYLHPKEHGQPDSVGLRQHEQRRQAPEPSR